MWNKLLMYDSEDGGMTFFWKIGRYNFDIILFWGHAKEIKINLLHTQQTSLDTPQCFC